MTGSALYEGSVTHARQAPAHAFTQRLYLHLFDLQDLPTLEHQSRLFGYNRPRPVALWDRDHLGDPAQPILTNVHAFLARKGFTRPVKRVVLLTQCRVFGYVFNPVSFFYCLGHDDDLLPVVAEVHNTCGQVHPYLLMSSSIQGTFSGQTKKVFHVSPFMSLDGTYDFTFSAPGETLRARLDLVVQERLAFSACLTLRRLQLSDHALLRLLAGQPLMPQRVIAGIHWQALRLWRKGARFYPKPAYNPDLARQASVS